MPNELKPHVVKFKKEAFLQFRVIFLKLKGLSLSFIDAIVVFVFLQVEKKLISLSFGNFVFKY